MAAIYKARYCQSDNTSYARHQVFLAKGKNAVPADLYPNDRERAAELVSAG